MVKTVAVNYFDYTDLIRLENADTRVALLANSGVEFWNTLGRD